MLIIQLSFKTYRKQLKQFRVKDVTLQALMSTPGVTSSSLTHRQFLI